MRRPSRQLNIFSMSAIDLFASAMGAFVVIAVILFPYYLKQNTPRQEAPTQDLSSLNQKLEEAEKQITNLTEEVRNAENKAKSLETSLKPKNVEIVFICDTTGSMGSHIEGIKSNLRDVVDILRMVNKKTRIGFVAYKDIVEQGHPGTYVTKSFPIKEMNERSFRELNEFVGGLTAFVVANVDQAESLSIALDEALAMDWSNTGKRIIVCITDAPARDTTKALSQASSFAASSKNNNPSRVSSILARTTNMAPETPGFLKELAKQGKGEYIEDTGRMLNSLIRATLSD